MSVVTGKSIDALVAEYSSKGYGEFKADVAEAVVETLRPIRARYDDLSKNKDYLIDIYTKGAETANRIADRTMRKVYKKVGFVQ